MTCMVCNPTCGKCRPAAWRTVVCPECGKVQFFKRRHVFDGLPHFCEKCGADVAEQLRVDPVTCAYSGLVCAYPCGRSIEDHGGEHHPCENHTPVGSV